MIILLNLEITGNDSNFPLHSSSHLTPPTQSTSQYHPTSSLPLPPRHSPPRSSHSNNPYDAQRGGGGGAVGGRAEIKPNITNNYPSNNNAYPSNNYPLTHNNNNNSNTHYNNSNNNKPVMREDLREAVTPISALNPYSNRLKY